jgi:endonuclease YncB( thermonuclease family)
MLLSALFVTPQVPAATVAMHREPDPSPVLTGKVSRVIDGDTVDVLLASGLIRVRLQGIDAPERNQPGGREAQHWLQKRLQGRVVDLEPVLQDRYDRLVAVVFDGEADINRELVAAGYAWAYRRYLRRSDWPLCVAEREARAAGRGLWRLAPVNRRAPWEYRHTRGRGPFSVSVSACGT